MLSWQGLSCHRFDARPGCIGRAVPGHEVRVVDEEGAPVEGQEGDVAVRRGSPVMMLEYWHIPGRNASLTGFTPLS